MNALSCLLLHLLWKAPNFTCVMLCSLPRLFSMFQSEQLNVRLLFRVLEALLCSMFPDRDLAQAFSHIRTQIQSKHKQS